jgi:lipopolysaccharide export system protein LptC
MQDRETGDGKAAAPRRRAYAAARRHSARVRLLKIVIPAGAALGAIVVGAVVFLDPFRRMDGVTMGPLSVSGTKITMENPRLTGYRQDDRPYEVTASAAMQDVRRPALVELKDMRGRLATDAAGGTARLEAATGVFDTQKEQLELKDDVRVRTDAGQDVVLTSASVDFKAGTVVSREPVTVAVPGGSIRADALNVSDGGKVIVFEGRVRSEFRSPEGDQAPAAGKAAQAAPFLPSPSAERGAPARTTEALPASMRP